MFLILIAVVALVGWALHLMQEATEQQEFSFMLAGILVASSAAALMSVYFLMGNCVNYLTQSSHQPGVFDVSSEAETHLVQTGELPDTVWWQDLYEN